MRDEWRDLSNSEVRLKLENRGVHPAAAEILVKLRDQEREAAIIESRINP